MIEPTGSAAPRRRVRVWFGDYAIADCVAEAPVAARNEAAMRRRFGGLRVTNEPHGPGRARVLVPGSAP